MLFVIKHFTKYTLCCRTHLTTLSHLLAVGGVTIMSKRINISSNFFHHRVATHILVFPYQWGCDIPTETTLTGGVECRWGIGRNRDSGLIAGYRRLLDVRNAKNRYGRRSWVYDSVGHAPLAIDRLLDVRTTKWQKQLPTTMQCRSHSRRRTIECLFVTACSMDEYAEEKRTKKNLIVRSGISEAETTNNKTVLDVLYWRFSDTKHRAASLRQQSFLF